MDIRMTEAEIVLARRVIGTKGATAQVSRNRLRNLPLADMPHMAQLELKGHARLHRDGYYRLTEDGVQQLRIQIG